MTALEALRLEKMHLEQQLAKIQMILDAHADIERHAAQLLRERGTDVVSEIAQSAQRLQDTVSNDSGENDESVALVESAAQTQPLIRPKASSKRRRSISAEVEKFETFVRSVLVQATKPLGRQEMYDKALEHGLELLGDTKNAQINVLGSRMSRMAGVQNGKFGGVRGYWLQERESALIAAGLGALD